MTDIYTAGLAILAAVGAMVMIISALLVVYAYWTAVDEPDEHRRLDRSFHTAIGKQAVTDSDEVAP